MMPRKKLKDVKPCLPCPQQKITSLKGKYYFDEKAANKAQWFFEKNLKHTKSPFTGKPFVLMPWERDLVIRPLFGWKRKDSQTRRFRRAFIEVPKKSGKSPLCAGIALYMLLADKEYEAEIYSVATDREQAKIVFDQAKSMVKFSPFAGLIEPNPIKSSTKTLIFPSLGGKYTTVSRETRGRHGVNASCVIFDELHALRDADLYDFMTEGSGAARAQPLHVTITTAGWDRTTVCYDEYMAAKRVIQDEREDEELLGVIFEAGERDDWKDPEVWKKANPSVGVTFPMSQIEHDCKEAQRQPRKQNLFKRLRLNIWTSQLTRWINREDWDKGGRNYGQDDLRGSVCFGGLDLSSTLDLTALVLAFPDEDGVGLWPYLFMPADRIEEASKRDNVRYDLWVSSGHIFATPGNVVNYDFILAKVDEAKALFDLQSVCFDPYNATRVVQECERRNIVMIPVSQNYSGMSTPSKEFERLLISGRLFHPKNPCLDWNVDNVEVRTGPNGVIAPNKPAESAGQQKRIDGVTASILSLERIARGIEPEKSCYEERDVRFV